MRSKNLRLLCFAASLLCSGCLTIQELLDKPEIYLRTPQPQESVRVLITTTDGQEHPTTLPVRIPVSKRPLLVRTEDPCYETMTWQIPREDTAQIWINFIFPPGFLIDWAGEAYKKYPHYAVLPAQRLPTCEPLTGQIPYPLRSPFEILVMFYLPEKARCQDLGGIFPDRKDSEFEAQQQAFGLGATHLVRLPKEKPDSFQFFRAYRCL